MSTHAICVLRGIEGLIRTVLSSRLRVIYEDTRNVRAAKLISACVSVRDADPEEKGRCLLETRYLKDP